MTDLKWETQIETGFVDGFKYARMRRQEPGSPGWRWTVLDRDGGLQGGPAIDEDAAELAVVVNLRDRGADGFDALEWFAGLMRARTPWTSFEILSVAEGVLWTAEELESGRVAGYLVDTLGDAVDECNAYAGVRGVGKSESQ